MTIIILIFRHHSIGHQTYFARLLKCDFCGESLLIRAGSGRKFHGSSRVGFFPFRTSRVGSGQHKFSGHVGSEFLSIGSKSGQNLGSKKAIFKVKNEKKILCTWKNCLSSCSIQLFQKNCTITITCIPVTNF